MPSEKLYQLALTLIPGIGNILTKQLISYCGSAREVFKTSKQKLSKIPGIGDKIIQGLENDTIWPVAEQELKRNEQLGNKLLFYTDPDYPWRLKQVADGPPLLYCKGSLDFNNPKVLAIVGTRQATAYGREVVEQLLSAIAKYNPLIVSGLAYGIDIHAHRCALKLGIPTVGVLASALNIIYPAIHKDVALQMLNNGGLISENRLDSKPDFHKFPERNRIIAGISDATLVIEAAHKGGALITASLAKSYNRKLFAVPGNINNMYSEGCNELLKTGKAALFTKTEDLEKALQWEMNPIQENKQEDFKALSLEESTVAKVFINNENEMFIDELSWKCQMPINKLAALLLNMEFKGFIKSLPGKRFRLLNKG